MSKLISNNNNLDLAVSIKSHDPKSGILVMEARLVRFSFIDKEDGNKIAITEKVVNGLATGNNLDSVQQSAIDKAVELMGLT